MAGDPFGLLLRQRIIFLGGEVRASSSSVCCKLCLKCQTIARQLSVYAVSSATTAQVNDFAADAIISQLLLLDSQDPNKVHSSPHDGTESVRD